MTTPRPDRPDTRPRRFHSPVIRWRSRGVTAAVVLGVANVAVDLWLSAIAPVDSHWWASGVLVIVTSLVAAASIALWREIWLD